MTIEIGSMVRVLSTDYEDGSTGISGVVTHIDEREAPTVVEVEHTPGMVPMWRWYRPEDLKVLP